MTMLTYWHTGEPHSKLKPLREAKAEGKGAQIGVLGAVSVCITVGAEGEGVEQGVLCTVTVCCIGVVALPLAFFALFALHSL